MSDSETGHRKESTVFQSQPFGKYTLLKRLGKGGMGLVYEAVDTVLNRKVAIKMIAPPDPHGFEREGVDEERFLREAQLSAHLAKHPNVVGVYEAGVIDGRLFLAMEFIEGLQMQEWRRGRPLRDQLALLRDIAMGVQHANENGVIHRDLKPTNVLVDAHDRPHITDFGLAKSPGPELKRSITTSGVVVGTPAYMSPEQAQGLKGIDGRSDVYSMGVILYEILTDRRPFEAETAMQLLVKVVEHPPAPPSAIIKVEGHPARDPRLEAVCLTALAKRREDRYPTARAFGEALGHWLMTSGSSDPLLRPKLPGRRLRGAIIAAAVFIALAVAGILLSLPQGLDDASRELEWKRPLLQGHTDKVLSIAFGRQAGLLASGSADRTLRLWDLATGRVTASLNPHAGKVEAIAFSPDGSLLAAVTEGGDGQPGEVKVWEIGTAKVRFDFKGHEEAVNAVAFSPDGILLASGDQEGGIRLWDLRRGGPEAVIERAHSSAVRGLVFSRDGRTIYSASWDHTAKMWDVGSRRERATLKGHAEGIWSLALSPDGTLLASASSDHTVKVWDAVTGKELRTIQAHDDVVAAVAFSPDGRRLATGGWDRAVKLWDVSTGRPLATYPGHTDSVWCAAFSPQGRVLATASLDGKVRLWVMPE